MVLWKKSLVASLVLSCLAGTGLAAWEEKEILPVEYQKIEYKAEGKLFWLQKPGEKRPVSFYQLEKGLIQLPKALELDSRDLVMSEYAYDGFTGAATQPLIQVQDSTDKSQKGLLGVDGKLVLPLGKYGNKFTYYADGVVLGKKEVFKDGEKVGELKNPVRAPGGPDIWYNLFKKKEVYNSAGEVLAKPEFAGEFFYYHDEMILAKSDGKDKKPKRVRVWNSDGEEITPTEEGFKDALLLKKTVEKKGILTNEIYGIFGRHEKGEWKLYPYEGQGKFAAPIEIDARESMYLDAQEVKPGFYRMGRPKDDGDHLLDVKNRIVREDANGIEFNDTRYTQQKWVDAPFAVPIFIGPVFTNIYVYGANSHMIRLRDENGKEITTLWGAVYPMENFIVTRHNKETKIIDYNNQVQRSFNESKVGFIPLVGKYDIPEQEEGKPLVVGSTDWENWPGLGRYQPYYRYGEWSVMDMNTAKEHISPEQRFGRIIKVSDDGNTFWSLIEEGKGKERRFGIKRFDMK